MRSVVWGAAALTGAFFVCNLSGCAGDDSTKVTPTDAGTEGSVDPLGLKPFTPPSDPGAGAIMVTASGESLAYGGYSFPPLAADDIVFVDGWEVQFDRLLVTLNKVAVSENPDKSPTDQSQTDSKVAELSGPWAVDLHKGGAIEGAGGGDERSVALGVIRNQNAVGGAAFDPTKRYAFEFQTVPATLEAMNVNLDEDAVADYKEMISKGQSVLYVGTARFRGTDCKSTDDSYDFRSLPKTVRFRFGFAAPTTYSNCQNPTNTGKAFDGEEAQRGIQVLPNRSAIAQITIHTDHPFWDAFAHDSPLHFDPIAARKATSAGEDAGVANVTLEDLVGVDFNAFKDGKGRSLPARSCVGAAYNPPKGSLGYDKGTVAYDSAATPDRALRDFRDFVIYGLSTQGHLNADGLCSVKRNYPSPP